MEDPGREIERMYYLLRHDFRPSAELQASLESFRKPGPVRPRFLIKSLFSIAIEAQEVNLYKYDTSIKKATQAFEKHYQPLQLGRELAVRRLGDGALKILLTTEDHDELNRLLDTTQNRLPWSVGIESEKPRFNLFVRIEPSQAIEPSELKTHGQAMLGQLRNGAQRLFHVTPEGISKHEEARMIPVSFFDEKIEQEKNNPKPLPL